MRKVVEFGFLALVFGGIGALAMWNWGPARGAPAGEGGEEHEPAAQVGHDEHGNPTVTIATDSAKMIGLATAAVTKGAIKPEITAYGVLEEDPAATFSVRAPLAGILFPADGHSWPELGAELEEGSVVGAIQPRFGPAERVGLVAQLTAARGSLSEAQAGLDAARASFDGKRELNETDKLVSNRVLEEAAAKVKTEEARLKAALETADFLAAALSEESQVASRMPLRVGLKGEVVEAPAQPGEAVESGQELLRVYNGEHMLARVILPPEAMAGGAPAGARITAIGYERQPMTAKRVIFAAEPDARYRGAALLCEVETAGLHLRPGTPVSAALEREGKPVDGFWVPSEAVLRYLGKAWVYVREKDDEHEFVRHEVSLVRADGGQWFVTGEIEAGGEVATVGSAALLSEELKSVGGGEEE